MVPDRWRSSWEEARADPRIGVAFRIARIVLPVIAAVLLSWLAGGNGLSTGGRAALFILVLAAGLWITEGIPAFAVSLLVIGYCISVLGRPGGVLDAAPGEWEKYVNTWGSPLIWLFFGGFVLARGAEKTGLTEWISINLLRRVGERPRWLLAAIMVITFTFSMFISNTAASTMMVAIVMPIVHSLAGGDPLRRSLLLGIAIGANVGGMGTIIGSPPNAIAAGALRATAPVDFARWMTAGLPPALCLVVGAWAYLLFRFPPWIERVDFARVANLHHADVASQPLWSRVTVMVTFAATVLLWMTQSLHGLPAPVVSFVPICVLTATGILTSFDVCSLRWDVLLLIAGGLALGIAVTDSGLANYLVESLRLSRLGELTAALLMAYVAVVLSNLMSNTAAANILVPLGLMAASGSPSIAVVPIALSASAAMALPISTPPNAVVHSTREISSRDLMEIGLIIALLAPLLTTFWCRMVL